MRKFITSIELAEMLGVSEGTLRNWRASKRGPPFIKLGKSIQAEVRYREDDIKSWLKKNSKVTLKNRRKAT